MDAFNNISASVFKQIVLSSNSKRAAILALGLTGSGNAYRVFDRKCQEYQVDTSHFKSKISSISIRKLKNAVQKSVSKNQVLEMLGLSASGGNYRIVNELCKKHNIDMSHFTGQNMTGRKLPRRRLPIQEYLKEGTNIQSFKLKRYLVEDGILEYKCSCCGISEWNGKPLSLQLDHINGKNDDNRLQNLRLLCPNCHSQTDTYSGKNKARNNNSINIELIH